MSQCIIFDCDGTLVDSEYLCNLGLEIKLREYGVKESADVLMEEFRGAKLTATCEALERRHAVKLHASFIPEYRELVAQLFAEQLQPIPGIREALAAIDAPMCVASNGPPEKIAQALTLTGLQDFFRGNIFSSYVVNSWKPDPGLFLFAAKAMGYDPADCAVVDDSEPGLQGAHNAGMQAYWYNAGGLRKPLRNLHQAIGFKHMSELPAVLAARPHRIQSN